MEPHDNNSPVQFRLGRFLVSNIVSIASICVILICFIVVGVLMHLSSDFDVGTDPVKNSADESSKQNMPPSEEISDDEYDDFVTVNNTIMVYFNDKNSVMFGDVQPILDEGEVFDINNILDSHYLIHNEAEALALCDEISKLENVDSVEYISKEKALEDMIASTIDGNEEYFEFLDGGENNPFSDGARVVVVSTDNIDDTMNQIKSIKGVSLVQYSGNPLNFGDDAGGLKE